MRRVYKATDEAAERRDVTVLDVLVMEMVKSKAKSISMSVWR